MAAESTTILERDIFGGSDSELSSDEEIDDLRQQVSRRPRDDDDLQSDQESADEYAQEDGGKQMRRKKRSQDEGGTSKKRKRRGKQVYEEQDLNDLPPEQANKIRLDMQIEAILKAKKGTSTRRKKKNDEDVLDRFADEEVSRLRELMLTAAADDDQANQNKLPATSKLRLLSQVMETLRKASLAQSMIDNNLLEGVKRWLEPLPDRSLPALNIQNAFFPILLKMEFIDASVLKESGLGRIVLFYTKCARVSPDIARIAHQLIDIWSRPIIKRSASFRDRVVPVNARDDEPNHPATMRLNTILARAKEREKGRVRKNAVAIPTRELGNYSVAPNSDFSRGNASVEMDVERRRKNAERLRMLKSKMQSSKA